MKGGKVLNFDSSGMHCGPDSALRGQLPLFLAILQDAVCILACLSINSRHPLCAPILCILFKGSVEVDAFAFQPATSFDFDKHSAAQASLRLLCCCSQA